VLLRIVRLAAVFLVAVPALAAPRKPQAASRTRVRVSRPAETRGYFAIVLGEPVGRFHGEPISLDLKDADLRDVLLTFSKLARLNMVIDPDVRGSVTVRLENVPWDQALEVILKSNGLGYVLEGSMVRVGTPARL
jgi:type II secretory pathway component HofQ